MKKALYILIGLFTLYWLLTLIAPSYIEKSKNKITSPPPYQTSAQAQKIYKSLDFISDLHCDALLWDRDLTEKSSYGHVDFPRLRASNVALQAFTIVTKSPKGQNIHQNSADATDRITALTIVQGQPPSTWFSLLARAKYQCHKLEEFAQYDNDFFLIRSNSDFKQYLKKRKSNPNITAGFLGIEGAHCLEEDLRNLDVLYEAGVRMLGPTHFFDNALGGSAHGASGEGLTPFGEKVIDRMNELKIIIDLAHISPKMIDGILDRSTRPVIVSHTGVKGVNNTPRNLSDAHIKRIAQNGGLIGVAFFPGAIGSQGVKGIVTSMKYIKNLVGTKYIALGSDYDGSVTVPFDVTGLPLIVEEMLKQGFTQQEIKAIMGENVKSFMLRQLP